MAKKPSNKAKVSTKKPTTRIRQTTIHRIRHAAGSSYASFLARRPHRSFHMTKRRDYARQLSLPGYWGFTAYVWKKIFANKKLFIRLIVTYAVLGGVFVGLASQDLYTQLSDILDTTGGSVFSGGWGAIGQAGLLLFSGLSGGLTPELTEAQQIYSVILFLMTWLTTVWILRATLSGNVPRIRDALYNAGAPIVSTGVVLFMLILQLVPVTLGIIVLNAAISTNLLDSGFIAMLISIVVGLLGIVSLYFMTSTMIALVVVTLPGMYPWQAIRTAGDLVVGRRVRILLRLLWALAGSILSWGLIVLIAIMIDRGIRGIIPTFDWLPIVPVVIAFSSTALVVWLSSYVYLLYRKVVEDDAAPA